MAKKSSKRGRPKSLPPDHIVIQARVAPDMHAALEKAAGDHRRTKNAELVVALELYLKSLGLWPPPPKAEG